MMKLLMFTTIVGAAAAAEKGPSSSSSSSSWRPNELKTKDLESATRQFVEENLEKKKSTNALNSEGASGKRLLRSSSVRMGRGGKGGKASSSSDSYDRSGKSGKTSRRGRGHDELFYLLPTDCPDKCVTSHVSGSNDEFINSIKTCKEHEDAHQWLVRSHGSYIMIESYYDHDMCIAVDFEHGDSEAMLAKTCLNGELVLRDCNIEYGTEWYFTGGQLVNSLCWGAGLSSMMTVSLVEEYYEDKEIKECNTDLAVFGGNDYSLLKADTFMFVNRLPKSPFNIDDVDDAINEEDETMPSVVPTSQPSTQPSGEQ